jgi:hypothetical protein
MGHPLAVPDNRAGKKGRCPVCRQRVYIPQSASGSLSDDDVAELLADPLADADEDDVEVDESADSPPEPPPKKPAGKPSVAKAPRPSKAAPAEPKRPKPSVAVPEPKEASRSPKKMASASHETSSPETSGDPHRRLETLVGEWTCRIKLWVEPDGSPELSDGEAEAKWMMDERFVQVESRGALRDRSFSSLLVVGYDELKKAYASCYLDSRGTGFFLAEGQADADGQALKLFGNMQGWRADEHSRACLYVIHMLHHAKWNLELHDVLRGEKVLEIVYTRKC